MRGFLVRWGERVDRLWRSRVWSIRLYLISCATYVAFLTSGCFITYPWQAYVGVLATVSLAVVVSWVATSVEMAKLRRRLRREIDLDIIIRTTPPSTWPPEVKAYADAVINRYLDQKTKDQ